MSLQTIPFGTVLSQFVVLPGFKTSKLGERVTYGVATRLESARQLGVYVHSTGVTEQQKALELGPLIEGVHEINGSAEVIFNPLILGPFVSVTLDLIV